MRPCNGFCGWKLCRGITLQHKNENKLVSMFPYQTVRRIGMVDRNCWSSGASTEWRTASPKLVLTIPYPYLVVTNTGEVAITRARCQRARAPCCSVYPFILPGTCSIKGSKPSNAWLARSQFRLPIPFSTKVWVPGACLPRALLSCVPQHPQFCAFRVS